MNNQDRLILDKEQLNDLVNSCQEEIRRLNSVLNKLEKMTNELLLKISLLKEENQRLNNILKLKTDFIAELLKIILVSRDYELQDKCEIRAKIYEEKLQELKESDK